MKPAEQHICYPSGELYNEYENLCSSLLKGLRNGSVSDWIKPYMRLSVGGIAITNQLMIASTTISVASISQKRYMA